MSHRRQRRPCVTGQFSVYVGTGPERRLVAKKSNLLMYTWGCIAARTIGLGDPTYKVSAGYLEFENSQVAGGVVVPSYGRGDGASYYAGLSGNKDYVRIALAGVPAIDQDPGSVGLLPAEAANRARFTFNAVGGTSGARGKSFSNASTSVLYGVTLVATPLFSDPSRDVILSRGYFRPIDQFVIPPVSQVQIDWLITFG